MGINLLILSVIFLKTLVDIFQVLFGKEADKLEHANDDERTYYIIEKDAVVSRYLTSL